MSEVEPTVMTVLRMRDAQIATLKAEMAQLTNMTAEEYRGILVRAEQGEHLADNLRTWLKSEGKEMRLGPPRFLVNALRVYDRYVKEAED